MPFLAGSLFRRLLIVVVFFMLTFPSAAAVLGNKDKAENEYTNGLMLYRAAQFQSAIDHLNACVAEDSRHPRAWNLLGLAYINTGDLPDAEKAFKKALDINSKDPYAYNNLGRVYVREKNQEEAEKAFRKQIEINGHDKYASYNLGLLLRERGDYEDAIKELENAAFYSTPNPKVHIDLGEIYLRENKPDKANVELDKAVQISPTPLVWNNVAYTLARHQTDLDKAKKLAESAVTITATRLRAADLSHPTRAEFNLSAALASYWDTLGWVYYEKADYSKAEPYLKSSWQVSHHGEIAEHLGDLEQRLGNHDTATKWYALASVAERPSKSADEKLASLAPQQAEQLKSAAKDALATESRMRFANASKDGDYKVAIAYSSDAEPAISFMSKDANDELIPELKKTKYPITFPDGSPTTLLLASEVKCANSNCDMSLLSPEVPSRDENLALGATGEPDVNGTAPRPGVAPGMTPPQVIKQVNPIYPEEARRQRLEGPVRVEMKLGTDGKPDELRTVDGNPVFYQAAMDAVKKWRFKPATTADGNPVAVKITVELNFTLHQQ